MSGPKVPPNTAAAASAQRIQRIPIQITVNNPIIGAPQFAAISSISDTGNSASTLLLQSSASNSFSSSDDVSGNNNNSDDNNNNDNNSTKMSHLLIPYDPSQQAASLFTAFPHDRGSWNAIIVDRSHPAAEGRMVKAKCFSTWASPDSYKGFFSLAAASGELSDDDDENDEDEDDNLDEDDAGDEQGNDDANALQDGENEDDDGEEDDKKKNRKKRRPQIRRKKYHNAFKRMPDRRQEAWFVLTENTTSTPDDEQISYDMLPLTEVFSCRKREYETDKQQERPDGKAPKLYFCESTKSGVREERKEDRREAKMEALKEEEERKKRRRQRKEK